MPDNDSGFDSTTDSSTESSTESGLYEDSYEDSEYATELMDFSYENDEEGEELVDPSYDHNEYEAELLDFSYESAPANSGLYENSYEDSQYATELSDFSYENEEEQELVDPSYDHHEYEAELMDFSYETVYNDAGVEIQGPPVLSDDKFAGANGNTDWNSYAKNSDENGFDTNNPIETVTLPAGTVVARYGSGRGHYASDQGTEYGALSLPYEKSSLEYHEYVTTCPITCQKGVVAENFGQKGGGTQYMFTWSFSAMERGGMITEAQNGK